MRMVNSTISLKETNKTKSMRGRRYGCRMERRKPWFQTPEVILDGDDYVITAMSSMRQLRKRSLTQCHGRLVPEQNRTRRSRFLAHWRWWVLENRGGHLQCEGSGYERFSASMLKESCLHWAMDAHRVHCTALAAGTHRHWCSLLVMRVCVRWSWRRRRSSHECLLEVFVYLWPVWGAPDCARFFHHLPPASQSAAAYRRHLWNRECLGSGQGHWLQVQRVEGALPVLRTAVESL